MPIKVFTGDLYETGVATATNYATAGAASARVYVGDANAFSIIMIAGASQSVDYKVQINNLLDPLVAEASPGWADYVTESTVAATATEAISYGSLGFRWVRIIQQLDTSTDDITWAISTVRDKAGN